MAEKETDIQADRQTDRHKQAAYSPHLSWESDGVDTDWDFNENDRHQ